MKLEDSETVEQVRSCARAIQPCRPSGQLVSVCATVCMRDAAVECGREYLRLPPLLQQT